MNIRVDLNTPITDGTEVVFRSPVDCSQITGLIVYYNGESKEFAFTDAHGNNVGDIDHLFAENVVVKVILDVTSGKAFVQNADTNAYLEGRFAEAVTHVYQKLSNKQKEQVRENIGAAEYEKNTATYTFDKDSTYTEILSPKKTLSNSTGKIMDASTSAYKVFYFTAEEDFEIYVSKPYAYFKLGIYDKEDGTFTGANMRQLYIKNGSSDAGNLPTADNKAIVKKDQIVAFSTNGTSWEVTAEASTYKCNFVVHNEPQALTPEQKAQARANIGVVEVTDYEKYFDIDDAGLVSLKDVYRGVGFATNTTTYEYSVSDKELGNVGSKNAELPERIVIPQTIGGVNVTGFQVGAFAENRRIKEVVIPSTVTSLPSGLFYGSINLKKVENTEQITEIGGSVFMRTGIEEIRFPNLVSTGTSVFRECSLLRLVDIGEIESIGAQYFNHCNHLSTVLGGDFVTEIGKLAFNKTRRLKSLPFIANVTSVGDGAFFGSKCNLEALSESAYANATNATFKQYNTKNANTGKYYWEGVWETAKENGTAKVCKNTIKSLFDQHDTRWASHTIKGTSYNYGDHSCALIVLAEMYSAFTGEQFDSPEDFVDVLDNKFPDWVNHDFIDTYGWVEIAKGLWTSLGWSATNADINHKTTVTADVLTKIYEALADGALVYRGIGSGAGNSVDKNTTPDYGHAVLCYGVNADGELLIADSAPATNTIGVYGNFKFASHIFTQGSEACDVVIVRKPSAS